MEMKEPNEGEWSKSRPMFEHQVMKAQDMDVLGNLFGLRYVSGGGPPGIIELYIEDDENFHFKCSFNHVWLADLAACVALMQAGLLSK